MLYIGILTACSFILLFHKLGITKILGYDIWIDMLGLVVFGWMFYGTFSGMTAAVVCDVIIALYLYIARAFLGYEKLVWRGRRLQWQYFTE